MGIIMSKGKSEMERAIKIALCTHEGQVDLAKRPYILHPLWVMSQMESETEKIVAVLHDVVEDNSNLTIKDLRKKEFSPVVVEAIYALTRQNDEKYGDYVQRIKKNPLARKVKLADLEHNLDMNRIPSHSREQYTSLMKRYRKAHTVLMSTNE